MNILKVAFIFVFSIFLSGCFAGIPVVGPAVGTLTDSRVITGATGSYGCAQLAQTIDDTRLRRDVLRRCYQGVDARGRQVSANAPNTHCRETITYGPNGVPQSTMRCVSEGGVERSTDRVQSGLPSSQSWLPW